MPHSESTMHWLIDHWPFTISIIAFMSATATALYVALKIKLPEYKDRIRALEVTMANVPKVEEMTQAIARIEGNCTMYRDDCQNAICTKLEQLRADLRVNHKEYEAVQKTNQEQAVIVARIDERVKLLLGTVDSVNNNMKSLNGNGKQ